ncbi:MAG: DUF1549 and DUF1553 domain-containing protein [Planctomycetota bacterium]|nr:DUF1549 and DUF1553 domain-containing protein [Planctomycetota bacterium]
MTNPVKAIRARGKQRCYWLLWSCLLVLAGSHPSVPVGAEQERDYWAFRGLPTQRLPAGDENPWVRTSTDRFVLNRAQEHEVVPNGRVGRRRLIRRAYFDLIGLAPTRDDVERFVDDPAPDAYERLLSRLLANPHYGERWGRHWLDVARYGESHGYESDSERPTAWTYRDAVIRAFNEDLAFDQFVHWQLAGDLLQAERPLAVALTGFITAGPTVTNVDGVDREKAMYDKMDDIVASTGSAFLALTVGCARCHDHKYDPIAQRDYYRLVGFFLPGSAGDRELAVGRMMAKVKAFTWKGGAPKSNPLLERGDTESKGGDVGRGVLAALSADDGEVSRWIENSGKPAGDGRVGLAHWLTDTAAGAGALTARVIANRLWQFHFGTGLVKTSNNFGRVGDIPSHPDLLDWLAAELIRGEWRWKRLHREIMASSAYTQSTSWDRERHQVDPENQLLWRRHPLRLQAEILRDAIMHTAGTLDRQFHGPSVKPWVSHDAIKTGSTNKWPTNIKDGPGTWRRSVYVFMRRSMRVPFFETFDVPDAMQSRGSREQTTVSTQALLLLNNAFVRGQAEQFARRLGRTPEMDPTRVVEDAYWLTLSRPPTKRELDLSVELLSGQGQTIANFCHILFTLNEFLYVD